MTVCPKCESTELEEVARETTLKKVKSIVVTRILSYYDCTICNHTFRLESIFLATYQPSVLCKSKVLNI